MKKFLAVLAAGIIALSFAACKNSDSKGKYETGSGLDAEVGRNADINIASEKIKLDGKEAAVGDLTVKWMLDNGFVLTNNADYSEEHEMRAYGTESFSFVKAGSEDSMSAVLVTLTFMNQSADKKPFRTAKLTEVMAELGDEATSQKFEDIAVEAPFGIVGGASLSSVEGVLGSPTSSKASDKYSYTTSEWLTGKGDYVQVRIGEKMGLVRFSLIMN